MPIDSRLYLSLFFLALINSCGVAQNSLHRESPNRFQAKWQDSGISGPPDSNGNRRCPLSHLVIFDGNQTVSYSSGCWSDGSDPNMQLTSIFLSLEKSGSLNAALKQLDFAELTSSYVTTPTVSEPIFPPIYVDFFVDEKRKTSMILSDDPDRLPAGVSQIYTFLAKENPFQ